MVTVLTKVHCTWKNPDIISVPQTVFIFAHLSFVITTRYYAVVSRGNGSALRKLKILYVKNAFNICNLPNIVA